MAINCRLVVSDHPQQRRFQWNGLLFARFQASPIALNVFQTHFRKAELSFLKFSPDKDEPLLLSFVESLQACSFRR